MLKDGKSQISDMKILSSFLIVGSTLSIHLKNFEVEGEGGTKCVYKVHVISSKQLTSYFLLATKIFYSSNSRNDLSANGKQYHRIMQEEPLLSP